MIERIRGQLIEKSPTSVVVDCGGVGYALHISLSTYEALPEIGEKVDLYAHLIVREDIMQLYGFSRTTERDLFLLLISVSKIGPKTAQATLSGTSVAGFVQAIRGGNITLLTKIPGIGKQTAERLVVELKNKIDKISMGEEGAGGIAALPSALGHAFEEAALALETLGYKRIHAEKAVQRVADDKGRELPVEEIIKFALKYV